MPGIEFSIKLQSLNLTGDDHKYNFADKGLGVRAISIDRNM